MVSIGTIATLGIVAAVGIAGYAVYTNLGKIGGAVSLGVTKSITDPFGIWLDNLFKTTSTNGVTNTPQDIIVQAGGIAPNPMFVDDPNLFNPPCDNPGHGSVGHIHKECAPTQTPPHITVTPKPSGGSLISVDLYEGGAPPAPPVDPVYKINGQIVESFPEKLYKLLTPGGQCIGTTCVKPIPLSTSEIYQFAIKGQLAHEVYL